jgi:flagellin-like hook-associated protein FlgL
LIEFKNVLDVTYGAYVVNGACTGVRASVGGSTQPTKHDQAIAVIREFLPGKTAAVRQTAEDASTAVSVLQIFTDAIETIAEKLAKMLELAQKVHDQHYSPTQVEQMQKQFRNLVQQINQTAKGTEYKFNKPFSDDGRTLSIPTGNGTKIDLFARNFRINAEELNIETESQKALSKVSEAITNVREYKTYLDRQAALLRDITTSLQSQIDGAMGVDMHDFQPELAAPMADYAASLISQDKQTSLNTQTNLTPDEILKLLKDNG